jgi:hypothetical protein
MNRLEFEKNEPISTGRVHAGVVQSPPRRGGFGAAGSCTVPRTAGQTQTLELKLRRVQEVLGGYVAAQVKPGDRPFLVLPFPVCLWRAEQGETSAQRPRKAREVVARSRFTVSRECQQS